MAISTKVLAVGLVIGLVIGLVAGYIAPKGIHIMALEKQISDLEKQVGTLQAQIKDKDATISSLGSQVGSLQEESLTKTNQLDELQTKLSGKDAQIADLKTQISTLQEEINSLKKELDELKKLRPPIPIDDNMFIGAYYYPWYGGLNYHWDEGYSNNPKLGEYSSFEPNVADWHIKWAVDYGIDFFIASWWGPYSEEENALKQGLLRAKYIDYIRFCIFYESLGRMEGVTTPSQASTRFLEDVKYIAQEFFNHPQYLKVKERPVLAIYAAGYLYQQLGESVEAIDQCREELADMGYNVYITGDIVGADSPPVGWELIRSFDAVTAYFFHLTDDWDEILNLADTYYDEWLTDMNSIDVEFIPNIYPGFDKTHSKFYRDEPVLVRNVERFSSFCNITRLYVDDNINMVIVTTWNEWHEGTTIEPAIEYDFEYLQVIKTTLAGYR